MNAAAVAGSLIDVKNVNTHKVVRLSIDVPAEEAAKVLQAFGWPTAVNPIPVAVARLVVPAAMPAPETKRSWGDLSFPQQTGIRCSEEAFGRFLREHFNDEWEANKGDAAATVRALCGVHSRAAILPGTKAGTRWQRLDSDFREWMREPAL
jgi:hypothetical protein